MRPRMSQLAIVQPVPPLLLGRPGLQSGSSSLNLAEMPHSTIIPHVRSLLVTGFLGQSPWSDHLSSRMKMLEQVESFMIYNFDLSTSPRLPFLSSFTKLKSLCLQDCHFDHFDQLAAACYLPRFIRQWSRVAAC
jgi:hypothetical protein